MNFNLPLLLHRLKLGKPITWVKDEQPDQHPSRLSLPLLSQ